MNDYRSCRPAVVGWIAVVATVVGYDAWALLNDRETLSGAFWRARNHPHARYAALGLWTGVTWHLLFGDKRVASERISETYRRNHPLWAINARLKAAVPAKIYVDQSNPENPLVTLAEPSWLVFTNGRADPKSHLN